MKGSIALDYGCEIDTAVTAEKQENAKPKWQMVIVLSVLLMKLQNKNLDTDPDRSTKIPDY